MAHVPAPSKLPVGLLGYGAVISFSWFVQVLGLVGFPGFRFFSAKATRQFLAESVVIKCTPTHSTKTFTLEFMLRIYDVILHWYP